MTFLNEKIGLSLELIVIEYFANMDVVHVHSKQQIHLNDLDHPRSLVKHLVTGSEILKYKTHRLYYEVPPSGMVMPLDDIISCEVFSRLFHRNVNSVYAVIVNSQTTDYVKVVKMYMKPTVDIDQIKNFQRTVAKPFSHRPMEPEIDTPDTQFYIQQSLHSTKGPVSATSFGFANSSKHSPSFKASTASNKNHHPDSAV